MTIITPTGWPRPARSDLIVSSVANINARVTGAAAALRRSFLNAFAKIWAGGLDGAYGALEVVADNAFPDTMDLDHLTRFASLWGVTPKQATAAMGACTSTANCTVATDIPIGTVLQRADQTSYVTTADVETVIGQPAVLAIQCEETGAAGTCDAGVVLTLVSPIAGVPSTFAVEAEMDGNDAETAPELLARVELEIQDPPTGGGPGDYEKWALEMPGVTRAWEYPLMNGLGTVGLTFVFDDREDILPLDADVAAMQAHLDSLAPITVGENPGALIAFACVAQPVAFTIHLTPSNADTKAAATAALQVWMAQNSAPGPINLLKAQYDQAIQGAAGVTDHAVSVPAGNVAVAAGHFPTLGVVTFD